MEQIFSALHTNVWPVKKALQEVIAESIMTIQMQLLQTVLLKAINNNTVQEACSLQVKASCLTGQTHTCTSICAENWILHCWDHRKHSCCNVHITFDVTEQVVAAKLCIRALCELPITPLWVFQSGYCECNYSKQGHAARQGNIKCHFGTFKLSTEVSPWHVIVSYSVPCCVVSEETYWMAMTSNCL